jgi:glucose-1-phosphate cytidylyltransferase
MKLAEAAHDGKRHVEVSAVIAYGGKKMKVVILAGGLGTRISEESHLKPKPMIEIGGRPILWHIMKYYSEFGFHDFVICLGYKQYVVKEFFADYFLHTSDVTFDLANNRMEVHNNYAEPWKVTLVDTGLNTMTGGRVKRIQPYIGNEPFMLTYGDGVCNVDLKGLVEFHKSHGKTATITTVSIDQQKGVLDIGPDNTIRSFREKAASDGAIINGGFMVLNPEVFSYLKDDTTVFEQEPMTRLAAEGQLMSFYHDGFWQCMDTQREMQLLETLWQSGNAPWKIWKE